jgi:phospholipid/cholesterol/gamma-HCH transport system substrate-binding protein
VEVEMRIDRDAAVFIHEDALARIGSDGLIGNRIVVLYGGSTSAPAIEDGDVLAAGDAPSTEDILAMLDENNRNLLAITTDLKAITRRLADGEGTAGRLLSDDALVVGVTDAVASLKSTSDDARGLVGTLDATARDLRGTTDRADGLLDDLSRSANDRGTPVGALLGDPELAADLAATADHLDKSSALLEEDLEAVQHNVLFRRYFKKKRRAEQDDTDPP